MNTYQKVSNKIGKGVNINPDLCLYNPSQVVHSLKNNFTIKNWLKFISNHYLPKKKDVLLIYPCSTTKPYSESRSYKKLFKTLNELKDNRASVHLMTISEPFGLIPEEYYGVNSDWHDWQNDWYDCPGLFEWWCKKHSFEYNKSEADEALSILSDYIADLFIKVDKNNCYKKKIGLVRTYSSSFERKHDHTHRRMLEQAVKKSGTDLEILPTKKMVSKIVTERGSFA
jgi:archaeosine synthase